MPFKAGEAVAYMIVTKDAKTALDDDILILIIRINAVKFIT